MRGSRPVRAAALPGQAGAVRRSHGSSRAGCLTARDENWKYLDHAPHRRIRASTPSRRRARSRRRLAARLVEVPAARRSCSSTAAFRRRSRRLPARGPRSHRPRGPDRARSRSGELAAARAGRHADDRFALLADAFAAGGVAHPRRCRTASVANRCTSCTSRPRRSPAVHQARVVVDVGADARLTLFEHFVALGDAAALGNLAAEIALGADPQVSHLRAAPARPATAQVETWFVRAAARSRYDAAPARARRAPVCARTSTSCSRARRRPAGSTASSSPTASGRSTS